MSERPHRLRIVADGEHDRLFVVNYRGFCGSCRYIDHYAGRPPKCWMPRTGGVGWCHSLNPDAQCLQWQATRWRTFIAWLRDALGGA